MKGRERLQWQEVLSLLAMRFEYVYDCYLVSGLDSGDGILTMVGWIGSVFIMSSSMFLIRALQALACHCHPSGRPRNLARSVWEAAAGGVWRMTAGTCMPYACAMGIDTPYRYCYYGT